MTVRRVHRQEKTGTTLACRSSTLKIQCLIENIAWMHNYLNKILFWCLSAGPRSCYLVKDWLELMTINLEHRREKQSKALTRFSIIKLSLLLQISKSTATIAACSRPGLCCAAFNTLCSTSQFKSQCMLIPSKDGENYPKLLFLSLLVQVFLVKCTRIDKWICIKFRFIHSNMIHRRFM